jgi:hypothetical protein
MHGMSRCSGGPIGSQTPDGYDALGPVVTQPIEFPHYIHVEQMGIDCLYCHTYARRSAVSGIPRLNKCIGCHQKHRVGQRQAAHQAAARLLGQEASDSLEKGPRLPDFVRFNHERHIQRFIFEQGRPTREACGYCHGDVGTMTTARRVKAISMGWCISCHEKDHKLGGRQRRDQPWAQRLLAMPQVGSDMRATQGDFDER